MGGEAASQHPLDSKLSGFLGESLDRLSPPLVYCRLILFFLPPPRGSACIPPAGRQILAAPRHVRRSRRRTRERNEGRELAAQKLSTSSRQAGVRSS